MPGIPNTGVTGHSLPSYCCSCKLGRVMMDWARDEMDAPQLVESSWLVFFWRFVCRRWKSTTDCRDRSLGQHTRAGKDITLKQMSKQKLQHKRTETAGLCSSPKLVCHGVLAMSETFCRQDVGVLFPESCTYFCSWVNILRRFSRIECRNEPSS